MDIEQEIKELVIARLKTIPEGVGLSIGSAGNMNKGELISHVEKGDEIGRKIVEVEMSFLRSFKDGTFYESLYSGNPA